MREIKFRAKSTDGVWKYGSYFDRGEYAVIYDPTDKTYYQCHLESLGQFTGLSDKNGVEIYEGDLVNVMRLFYGVNNRLPEILNVEYCIDGFELFRGKEPLMGLGVGDASICEVVGNTYDDPELLEVKR